MRKQYHLRRTPAGYDAWDVDRLVALAADLPVVDVPLSGIAELDEAYWFEPGGPGTVRQVAEHARLIAEADLAYPIVLSPEGRVMDGMHRVARALLDGATSIRAVRLAADPPPDHVGCDPDALPT